MFRILQYKIEKNFNLKRGFNDKKILQKMM